MPSFTLTNDLVFIDATVDNYQSLVSGVVSDATAIVVESHRDGIAQITAALTRYPNIKRLHIVSHGSPGCLRLGSTILNLDTLNDIASQIQRWSATLVSGVEVLLYGCNVAATQAGKTFVDRLSQLMGANVAASTTPVGSTALGGNWNLDYQVGAIASPLAFQPQTLAAYPSVLATAIPNLLYGVSGTDLRVLDLATGTATIVGTLAFPSFALARQANTGRVYYIENVSNGRVAYFDPATSTNTVLPNRTGVPAQFLKLAQSVSGLIYGLDVLTTTLYTIDQNTGTATAVGAISSGTPPFSAGSGDIAFDPQNPNRLFVSVTSTGVFNLYAVDITTRQATFIGNTGLNNIGSGALAFGQDGNLYATSTVNGIPTLFRLNQTTAAATAIGPTRDPNGTTPIEFNDFGSLPVPSATVNIAVKTTDGVDVIAPGTPVTYTVTVASPSSTLDVNGISIATAIPPSVQNLTWTASISPGGGSFPTPADASGTGNINNKVNLNANGTVTYTITGIVSTATPVGTLLSASSTVNVPTGVNVSSFSNITSTDSTLVALQGTAPPDTVPVTLNVPRNTTVPVTGLSATDPDPNGGISQYIISTLPSPDQGTLLLTNPSGGLTPITVGQSLTPAQISQIQFRPTSTFSRSTFTYTALDISGAVDPTPATVTLTVFGAPPVEGGEDICGPGLILRGDAGNNTLQGIDDIDRLFGFGGNDQIFGAGCPDYILGGGGDDLLRGDEANDVLRGGSGNDRMSGGPGKDFVYGGSGRDVLFGGGGNDGIRGNQGVDRLSGGEGNDSLLGGTGNDHLFGGTGNDRMEAGPGDDLLRGELGDDVLKGNGGGDRIVGAAGQDRMNGNAGGDRIYGQDGADIMRGGGGNDTLVGGDGNDRAYGGPSQDRIYGGFGNDIIRGGQGNDSVYAGAGLDVVFGSLGRDRLRGFAGVDHIYAGAGNDVIVGGSGADFLAGGPGKDTFYYNTFRDRGDRIRDFGAADDVINLIRVFRPLSRFKQGRFSSYVRLRQVGANTVVQIDPNGDRPGSFKNFVVLENVTANALSEKNFIV
ncbi:MAG TPA: DUF4347 domain-containing protein [Crinalium sp.]|jgi:hypothetical protein